ncbi:hypothetical protein HDV57DRAFT_392838 [Trichoderma longibrachiatum]|uniref:Uncharacterized protein n=1 Tax=Trichoderma longibrachiatum ATCC 18648 TaxID=983965 RepID=A0A2T4C3N0_TRILO|nr:hypothetical protein M440DRAFT_1246430 [Trichoderma longibrachiatum ATCC 18648]
MQRLITFSAGLHGGRAELGSSPKHGVRSALCGFRWLDSPALLVVPLTQHTAKNGSPRGEAQVSGLYLVFMPIRRLASETGLFSLVVGFYLDRCDDGRLVGSDFSDLDDGLVLLFLFLFLGLLFWAELARGCLLGWSIHGWVWI